MPIEIRVLSGARAGQVKRFEQAVIVVGRHASTDFRFDPQQDLDVSGRHAEIRGTEGRYVVHDFNSTNGTFVNGKKVEGSVELKDGDKVTFGAKGPETMVHIFAAGAEPPRPPVRSTEQRIAIAVNKQTAGLKRALIGGVVLLVLAGGAVVYYGRSQTAAQVEQLKQQLEENERMRVALVSTMRESGDTALANEMQRNLEALRAKLPGATSDAERDRIKAEIQENEQKLRRMVSMDLPAIFKRNSPAVAIMITDIAGKMYAGSGFSITPEGLLLTNRHNVLDSAGRRAGRIAIKFTETHDWLPARIVKISDHPDEDLALIQVEREGPFAAVAGVSSGAGDASEGMSVVTIGYPLGYDTPMEGAGNDDFLAKSTLNPGTVSKRTSSVLQIDSYATHGSSGSPVFSTRGVVVGIVYGGARDAGGKIVYAVPSERIAAFIPAEFRAIVKD